MMKTRLSNGIGGSSRVTLPKTVLDAAGFHQGQTITINVKDGSITIRPVATEAPLAKERVRANPWWALTDIEIKNRGEGDAFELIDFGDEEQEEEGNP